MKQNFLLKSVLMALALTCGTLFAQVKTPSFVEVSPSLSGGQNFPFLYEVAASWGDFNNDGFKDLMLAGVGSGGEATFLYKNDGNGSFTEITHTFPKLKQANITWFDFDNDGNLDVFLAGWDGAKRYSGLWKNKGTAGDYAFEEVMMGTFVQVNHGGGNRSNRYVVAGDYDNDGWTDLFIQGQTGGDKNTRVSYLYKNVNGTSFQHVAKPVKNQTGTEKPFIYLAGGSAAWGDFDNDGFLDLISSGEAIDGDKYDADYGYSGSYNGAVYKNNGNGTFSEPIKFLGTEEGDVAWIDYNNDGKLDFTVTGVSWEGDWKWLGDIMINENGAFTKYANSVTGLAVNKQSISIAVGDANNDGFEDILYMNADNSDMIYFNSGGKVDANPMFVKYPLVYSSASVAQRGGTANFVDFNNDNNLDAFLIGYGDDGASHGRLMENKLGEGIVANNAPNKPTNLAQMVGANGIVMLTWAAPTDDFTPTSALKYNVFITQGNKTRMVVPADVTTGRLKVDEVSGLIKKNTLYKVINVTGDFSWGVQAVDQSKAASAFAVYGTSNVKNELAQKIFVRNHERGVTLISDNDLSGKMTIYTTTGSIVQTKTGLVNGSSFSLSSGIYLINIETTRGIAVKKIVL